jgi:microsomal dipeptidase-like Zn-dependent dipeptidase
VIGITRPYSDEDIRELMGDNWLRRLRRVSGA